MCALTNFNTKFTDFGQKYFLGEAIVTEDERKNAKHLYKVFLAEFFEQLLLFDKVSIQIKGNNIALAILINELGLDLVQECVEDGTIELWLWTQQIFVTSGFEGKGEHDETLLKGIPPVGAAKYTSPQHSVPDDVLQHCFQWVGLKYPRNERRRFIRAVASKMKHDSTNFADHSTKFVISAYESNLLGELGLPFEKNANDFNFQERLKLLELASDITYTSFLASENYTSYNKFKSTLIAQKSLDKIAKALKVQAGLNKIIKLEGMPDLQSIFINNKIDFNTAVRIRKKKISKNFRDWLSTATDKSEIEYITKLYIDEITHSKGVFDSNKGKIIKTISLATIGGSIGFLAGGITGSAVGVTASKIVDLVADLGLGFFDSFILEKLNTGWTPRMFLDEIRNEIAEERQKR